MINFIKRLLFRNSYEITHIFFGPFHSHPDNPNAQWANVYNCYWNKYTKRFRICVKKNIVIEGDCEFPTQKFFEKYLLEEDKEEKKY